MYIKIEIFDDKTRDVCHQIWSSFFKPPGHTLTQPSVDFETLQSVINSSILFHWVECSKSFNFFFLFSFWTPNEKQNKTFVFSSPSYCSTSFQIQTPSLGQVQFQAQALDHSRAVFSDRTWLGKSLLTWGLVTNWIWAQIPLEERTVKLKKDTGEKLQ